MKSSSPIVALVSVVLFCSLLETVLAFSSRGVAARSSRLDGSVLLLFEAKNDEPTPKKKGFLGGFFDELDAFVDDATNRRLGTGAAFYGKRKSNFYGGKDKNRKQNRDTPDPTEDYQGPSTSGYFKWIQDDDGQLRPVTRMKEQVIERNPSFWDRVFSDD